MDFEDIIRVWPKDLLCTECGGLLIPRKPPENEIVHLACKDCQKNGQISLHNLIERVTGDGIDLLEDSAEPLDPDTLPEEARDAFFALAGNWQVLKAAGVTVEQFVEALEG